MEIDSETAPLDPVYTLYVYYGTKLIIIWHYLLSFMVNWCLEYSLGLQSGGM